MVTKQSEDYWLFSYNERLVGRKEFSIKASTHWMAYHKIPEKHSDYGHTSSKNFQEKICFIISRQMGPNNPPNFIKWIGIELGGDYLIKFG